ncbi:hypothetical protein BTUL_0026g00450 [Botrytis tulipae]|uniref:2EXR domain-containing protein n=1 Tax=Botrytis tulipae TaxID=87230 RepID=A0A4Z1F0I8_9HELO|nr:hypothetical protein BTUL_0026g00450 [Botrytis tulipae]
MSKDDIESRPAKSLGFRKAFVAFSRTSSLTIASIKQKFKSGVTTSHLPSREKDKEQRKPALTRVQAKNKPPKKKADKKKSEGRTNKDGKKSTKEKRTFNVPKRRSKARVEKRTRSSKVKKVVNLPKISYIKLKNFLKPVYLYVFYTDLYQRFGNPKYPLHDTENFPRNTKRQEKKFGLVEFKFYHKFPKEIRAKIWRATFKTRIVIVEVHVKMNTDIEEMKIVGAHMTVPLALSVCRESRAEALFWYKDLVPENVRPIYFHPTLDSFAIRAMKVARNADPKKRWAEVTYFVKDIIYFLGYMGSVYKEIPKFVRRITIPRACWSNDRHWDTRMQLAWNEGWGYDGLKEIVVLEFLDNTVYYLQHEKFLQSYFEIIKRTHPDCVMPRIRIILDHLGHLPYSSDDFSEIMGERRYEDIDTKYGSYRRYHRLTQNHPHNSIYVEDMVQYSHVPGGMKPKKRVVISKALAKISPRSIYERCNYKRFVAEPVDSESICFTNLPYEIRLMIWHYCFDSRVVTISATHSWIDDSRDYKPAVSSVHAVMPLTLSINRESRYETLLHYTDLIRNPGLFRDPVYFNPKLDKLAIHVVYKNRYRRWRVLTNHCLCYNFHSLADISLYSPNMCRMEHFHVSREEALRETSRCYGSLFLLYPDIMHTLYNLKTIAVQSPNANETMVLNNISKDGSWVVGAPVWKAIKSMENFEDDNWRITQRDDHNVPSSYYERRCGRSTELE